MGAKRLSAWGAGFALLVWILLAVITTLHSFPRGFVLVGLVLVAAWLAYKGLRRTGQARRLRWVSAGGLLLLAVVGVLVWGMLWYLLAEVLALAVLVAFARRAFHVRGRLSPAQRPKQPIVVWNPKSGGGKALKADLATQARARGIEPIELRPGDDLIQLVRNAVANGADGLAAAGGDGTQALVATIAAEHDLPFACIPAGTRNHFALDLGVDRNDVVGALDAFVSGGELRVDLAEVNGRVFVNNASLGLYAQAVQKQGYRDAKLRTILDTAPEMLNDPATSDRPAADAELRFAGPDGQPTTGAVVVLVSNNTYRLGKLLGAGTRPRMDAGKLGIAVMKAPSNGGSRVAAPWLSWQSEQFTVESDGPVPIGIDGEALKLAAPLEFRTRPGALRVRIAPQHPGASPSASLPEGLRDGARSLVSIMLGRVDEYGDPRPR